MTASTITLSWKGRAYIRAAAHHSLPAMFFSLLLSGRLLAQCLCYLHHDRVSRGFGISGARDRAADHEIIGADGNRARRRHDALLVVGRPAGGPDARSHQMHLMADDLAQAGRLFRRTNEAIDAERLRLSRACRDEIGDAEAIARSV